MTKRVRFDEEPSVHEVIEPKISKHTLDSDEEDETDEAKAGILNDDDIEGQEDGTVDFDEDIKITPFNMNDEMEEGHFDASGTFIFSKEKEIKDGWLDNIDWMKLSKVGRPDAEDTRTDEQVEKDEADEEERDREAAAFEKPSLYREMLTFMKPGESVLKAVRRLGGGQGTKAASASQRWAKKKKSHTNTQESGVDEADIPKMLRLTELADRLLQQGEFDVYQDTHEKLQFRVGALTGSGMPSSVLDGDDTESDTGNLPGRQVVNGSKPGAPTPAGDSDFDIFASDLTEKKPDNATSTATSASDTSDGAVMWELKRSRNDTAPIEGPYSSQQMLQWTEAGEFSTEAVFVRRLGTQGEFYSSRRIDFDLFT